MAKPRLKVYRAQMGFAEAVVAAPSQMAALKAWGARQNLFAEGLASVVEDADAVAAATAKPGVVLQKPVGAKTSFTEELVGRPEPPKAAPPKPSPMAPPKLKAKPRPDRMALTAAETALAAFEDEATARLADFDRRREQLDAEETRLRRDLDTRRSAAQRALEQARRAFEAA